MLAKIVHNSSPRFPDQDMPEIIKKMDTLHVFYKAMWNKKPDKIKRKIIVR